MQLFLLCCLIGNSLFGQQLTWMPREGDLQEKFYKEKIFKRSITSWDENEMFVHDPSDLFVMDVVTMTVKAAFPHNEIEKVKKGKYIDDILTTQRRGALVLSKTDAGYELTLVPISAGGLGEPITWHTFDGGLSKELDDLPDYIFVSDNKEYVLLAVPAAEQIEMWVFDASLKEVYRKTVPGSFDVNGRAFNAFEMDGHISDDGNVRLSVLLEDRKSSSRDWDKVCLAFLDYEHKQDDLKEVLVDLSQVVDDDKKAFIWPSDKKFLLGNYVSFNAPYGTIEGEELYEYGYDDKTETAIFAGLYKSADGGGVFTVQYDHKNDRQQPIRKHDIAEKTKEDMLKVHFKGKTPKRLNLRISDILSKANGDFLVLTDLVYEFKESGYLTYYSWDIVYQNINPENELSWEGNISRKFRSKTMGSGSFAAISKDSDVYLFFNQLERGAHPDLLGNVLKSDGAKMKLSLSNHDENAILVPVMPDQVPVQLVPLVAAGKMVKGLGTSRPVKLADDALLVFCVNSLKADLLLIKI
ncbi:MAG: hypothetical protein R2825_24995 [Saprospiraceae bacterium]